MKATDDRDFGRLFVQSEPRIYGYICSVVANRTDADDVLQDTASVLWRKFDEYEQGTNFHAWAMKIARFQVLYYYQRQRRDVLRFSEAFVDAITEDTVAAAAGLADLRETLASCLDRLKPRDRELFRHRYEAGATPESVAEKLSRPVSTVYNALRRIRQALHRCVFQKLAGGAG
jgi:RNA polymerase sigma-70 factor (ECF subfamily)